MLQSLSLTGLGLLILFRAHLNFQVYVLHDIKMSACLLREVVKTTTNKQDPPNHKIVGGVCLQPPRLRTFARNSSNIDFFLKILAVKVDELVMSEMWKTWGVTDFVLERTCPEVHPNLRKSGFVSEEDHSGLKSQNIAIRALKWSVLCQIWFKWA